MDTTGSVKAIESAIDSLNKQREDLDELWSARKLRLDLCLRLRIFERDALELSSQLQLWSEDLQNMDLSHDVTKLEHYLQFHSDNMSQIQNTTFQVLQQGQELLQLLDNSGICIMADNQYSSQSRIHRLMEFINDREVDLEEIAEIKRLKLQQCVQLCHFQTDSGQVFNWIRNGESTLMAAFSIPKSLSEAEQMRKDHEQFQVAIEKTHSSATQIKYR